MAEDAEELAEVVTIADVLVINIGKLSKEQINSMHVSAKVANETKTPINIIGHTTINVFFSPIHTLLPSKVEIYASKLNLKFFWNAMKPMFFMLGVLFVINLLVVKTGDLIIQLGPIGIYTNAISQTGYIAIRLVLMIVLTTLLTATTKPTDMTVALEDLMKAVSEPISAVGVSISPTTEKGSYMPCFLVGESVATALSSVLNVPLFKFSHQQGHIGAALYSANKLALLNEKEESFADKDNLLYGRTQRRVLHGGHRAQTHRRKLEVYPPWVLELDKAVYILLGNRASRRVFLLPFCRV